MSKHDFSWTEQNIEALRRMVQIEGLTFEAIGRDLGTTKNACIAAARRNGIARTKATPFTTPFQLRREAVKVRRDVAIKAAHYDPFPPKGHCVYPIGDPSSPDFRFCGNKAGVIGQPYCADHHRVCWQRVRATES